MRKLLVIPVGLAMSAALFAAGVRTQHLDIEVKGMPCPGCSTKDSAKMRRGLKESRRTA